jgi:hypothetical protein
MDTFIIDKIIMSAMSLKNRHMCHEIRQYHQKQLMDLLLDEFTLHINKTYSSELSYENFLEYLYCHILEGMPYLIKI